MIHCRSLKFFIFFLLNFFSYSVYGLQLVNTESDPDAFIQNCVNVISGQYCESATDLVIPGPDALTLQRFYTNKNLMTESGTSGWRIFPQRYLVIGKNKSGKSNAVANNQFEQVLAFVGERSGGILPYSGLRHRNGSTKDPLTIDPMNHAHGMVNTYAGEINGQLNHKNNLLHCKGETCELILGDGTKRIYKKVQQLPALVLGEELVPLMAKQVLEPSYFVLIQETLPTGNHIFFTYNPNGRLTKVEIKNKTLAKTFSWIRFKYELKQENPQIIVETSDSRQLTYHFTINKGVYELTKVDGSHCIPVSYEYEGALTKKILPEGRFVEIKYENDQVIALNGPNAQSGKSETIYSFKYSKNQTDVFNAMGVKSRYISDEFAQLIALEYYDEQDSLYRIEQKYWGKTKQDFGNLLAKTIGDGNKRILSYRSFKYDNSHNVIEERLYGNLTGGKPNISLQVSLEGQLLNSEQEESNLKMFTYSSDGFNLLTKVGDSKGNQTLYFYKPNTNLLVKKLIYGSGDIKKRTFKSYNDDGTCIKIIKDDGSEADENKVYTCLITERQIREITPKQSLPGVGLPLIIKEKGVDLQQKKELLVKKIVNTYDGQCNLLSCETYGSNDQLAFTEKKTYNKYGQVISHVDPIGKEIKTIYDGIGNPITITDLQDNKSVVTTFDFQNQPIVIANITKDNQYISTNIYDLLGRKIASSDHFGNVTHYEYDAFHRLIKIIHPDALCENNNVSNSIFKYTYDIFGNVLSIEDPKGFITLKTYNLRGQPTRINYPDGVFELFKYDCEGSLHRTLDRDQIITIYEYDYLGRCVFEELWLAGETGISTSIKKRIRNYNGFRCTNEKDEHIKNYHYDPVGRLISIIEYGSGQFEKHPEARRTDLIYDHLNRVHQKKVWFDNGPEDYSLEYFEYDAKGNIVEKGIKNAQGQILLQKYFRYDSQNNCIEEYYKENGNERSLIKTAYNSEKEPISYIDGCGQETNILIDHSYRNVVGQIVQKKTLVNSVGVQTEIEFDTLGRVFSIIKKDPMGICLSSQRTFYDSLGNKSCEEHDKIIDGKIIDCQKNRWIYGPMGRLEEQIEAVNSSLEKRTCYSYNSMGRLISKNMPGNLFPISFTYDSEGRISKIVAENSKKELKVANSYVYDSNGNIVCGASLYADSYENKEIRRAYNVFNQITKETVGDGEGYYSIHYAYDRKGRLKEVTLPDSSKIAYIYDAVFGREVKRISKDGELLYAHAYSTYDKLGKLLKENCIGNLGYKEYTYDLNGKKSSSNNKLGAEHYVRDSLGRLLEINSEVQKEYSYNHLSQLVSEKKDQLRTHAYDSLDNRIQKDNTELFYNSLNQLTSYSQAEFSYDPQGNLSRKIQDGEETRFENNSFAQLFNLIKSDKTLLNFSYDAFGRLLVEKHFDLSGRYKSLLSTTRYFYIENQEIGELSLNREIETLKVPGLHGDELSLSAIAIEIKDKIYVPTHDISGNVTSLIHKTTCEVVESYDYTAFGEETIYDSSKEVHKNSPIGNPWRFAEKRIDEKSGFILFGFRFYDPIIGRWISQDPAGFADGSNLYAYLHNNPLNHLDRFGLSTEADSQNKFNGYFYGDAESHCICASHRTCKRGGDIGKTDVNALPRISYCDQFEKLHGSCNTFEEYWAQEELFEDFRPYHDASQMYDLGLFELENMQIGFINGMDNSFEEAKASARYISKLAGGCNIHAVYNATHGKMVDVSECKMGLNYVATEPVRQLHKMWNDFMENSSSNAKFLMICHSQGAIHVRNALLDYDPALQARIIVLAIAPGGYIFQNTCAQVVHYRVKGLRDFIPRIDKEGAKRSKETIIELLSHPNAPCHDHTFLSPTYEREIKIRIAKYKKSGGTKI